MPTSTSTSFPLVFYISTRTTSTGTGVNTSASANNAADHVKSPRLSLPRIVGIVIGTCIGFIAIGVPLVWCCSGRKRSQLERIADKDVSGDRVLLPAPFLFLWRELPGEVVPSLTRARNQSKMNISGYNNIFGIPAEVTESRTVEEPSPSYEPSWPWNLYMVIAMDKLPIFVNREPARVVMYKVFNGDSMDNKSHMDYLVIHSRLLYS